MLEYRLVVDHDCAAENIGLLGSRITEYNEAAVGYDDQKRIAVFLKDTEGDVVAGVFGSTYWDWLDISLLWVREDLRGRGYGSQLLKAAEEEARRRDCKQVLLDTFSFQSPGFYRKHGYEVFGELEGFAGAHTRLYMRKALS